MAASKLQKYKTDYARKLKKALAHLAYSYQKVQELPTQTDKLDDEQLETWESFAARFARVADIFITRYLRTLVLIEDPAFIGSIRDILNFSEKKNWIESAEDWLTVRELRNMSAHDYTEKELSKFFEDLKKHTPKLLKITTR